MRVAVEGCAHGELDALYEELLKLESHAGGPVDVLLCCGDFQSVRNGDDLKNMAVPVKYRKMGDFHKYFTGEKIAPILTIFIGGNHEAPNLLKDLYYGGWVAKNIYYLGHTGVIDVGGLRIAGISGIFNPKNYLRGHFETVPYSEDTKRSAYHVRQFEVEKLKMLTGNIDIFLCHDWPRGVDKFGDFEKEVLKVKDRTGQMRREVKANTFGNPATEELINEIKPKYAFSAHMHIRYSCMIKRSKGENSTKFLALDKCIKYRDPGRYLQILNIKPTTTQPDTIMGPNGRPVHDIRMDPEWCAILKQSFDHISYISQPKTMKLTRPSQEKITSMEERIQSYGAILPYNQDKHTLETPHEQRRWISTLLEIEDIWSKQLKVDNKFSSAGKADENIIKEVDLDDISSEEEGSPSKRQRLEGPAQPSLKHRLALPKKFIEDEYDDAPPSPGDDMELDDLDEEILPIAEVNDVLKKLEEDDEFNYSSTGKLNSMPPPLKGIKRKLSETERDDIEEKRMKEVKIAEEPISKITFGSTFGSGSMFGSLPAPGRKKSTSPDSKSSGINFGSLPAPQQKISSSPDHTLINFRSLPAPRGKKGPSPESNIPTISFTPVPLQSVVEEKQSTVSFSSLPPPKKQTHERSTSPTISFRSLPPPKNQTNQIQQDSTSPTISFRSLPPPKNQTNQIQQDSTSPTISFRSLPPSKNKIQDPNSPKSLRSKKLNNEGDDGLGLKIGESPAVSSTAKSELGSSGGPDLDARTQRSRLPLGCSVSQCDGVSTSEIGSQSAFDNVILLDEEIISHGATGMASPLPVSVVAGKRDQLSLGSLEDSQSQTYFAIGIPSPLPSSIYSSKKDQISMGSIDHDEISQYATGIPSPLPSSIYSEDGHSHFASGMASPLPSSVYSNKKDHLSIGSLDREEMQSQFASGVASPLPSSVYSNKKDQLSVGSLDRDDGNSNRASGIPSPFPSSIYSKKDQLSVGSLDREDGISNIAAGIPSPFPSSIYSKKDQLSISSVDREESQSHFASGIASPLPSSLYSNKKDQLSIGSFEKDDIPGLISPLHPLQEKKDQISISSFDRFHDLSEMDDNLINYRLKLNPIADNKECEVQDHFDTLSSGERRSNIAVRYPTPSHASGITGRTRDTYDNRSILSIPGPIMSPSAHSSNSNIIRDSYDNRSILSIPITSPCAHSSNSNIARRYHSPIASSLEGLMRPPSMSTTTPAGRDGGSTSFSAGLSPRGSPRSSPLVLSPVHEDRLSNRVQNLRDIVPDDNKEKDECNENSDTIPEL